MRAVWRLVPAGVLAAVLVGGLAQCRGQAGNGAAAAASPTPPAPPRAATADRGPRVFPPARFYEITDSRGEKVDLRQFQGRVVVLNFWATWCGPCRFELPHLVELRRRFDPAKVAIIGVSVDQGEPGQLQPMLSRFVAQFGINYPIVLDPKFELLREFYRGDMSSLGVPLTFVIDREGRISHAHPGVPQDASGQPDPGGILGREIEALLGGS